MNKNQNEITVEKHDTLRDYRVDLTSRLGINREKYGDKFSRMVHTDRQNAAMVNEWEVPPANVPYHQLGVEWGLLSKQVRRQEVTKTEEWGIYTVKFVTYWFVTYDIQVPVDIIGG